MCALVVSTRRVAPLRYARHALVRARPYAEQDVCIGRSSLVNTRRRPAIRFFFAAAPAATVLMTGGRSGGGRVVRW